MTKEESNNLTIVAYVMGILSIVFSFFTPLASIVLGLIGLIQVRGTKNELSKKAKIFNIIGLILGFLMFITNLLLAIYFSQELQQIGF